MDSVYRSRRGQPADSQTPPSNDFEPDLRTQYGGRGGLRIARVAPWDNALVYTTLALVVVGLMSVFTASAAQADLETGNSFSLLFKQFISAAIGYVALLWMSRFPFEKLKNVARPFAIVSIGLLLMTMFAGTTANGSERWIGLPLGFQFQPSDFAKVAAILLMAQATSHSRSLMNQNTFINLAIVGVMIALIYQQPNLSVSMILGILTFVMLFLAGLSTRILVPTLIAVGFVVYKKILETPYQLKRIIGWLNPWQLAQDAGYNLIQSYYAIGSGGVYGVGLGNSIQKLYYLPFQHTDFIFSVICEEWGMIGAAIVIGMFGLLAWRGFTIAYYCPSRFGKMLAFGLTLAIVLQASINICVTVGLMPVTGVTLPLISYGGTSMVVTLAMIGILLNISRYRAMSQHQEAF